MKGDLIMRLKRWESPRREGRNDKGRKNPARQRQIKAQTQALRRKLKGNEKRDSIESLFLSAMYNSSNKSISPSGSTALIRLARI
jgi:hypothetical protein